jgi:predicted amidohydrolase
VSYLKQGKIRVATCQFPVSGNIRRNADKIIDQIKEAKARRADVAHFPETGLPGYGGMDYESWKNFDWNLLYQATEEILSLARRRKIWVILGSTHRLTGQHLPHNSMYAISPEGRVVDRYDKRFCTDGDLRFYSPGDHFTIFDINGVRCGMLICYDVRFPELYREYSKLGVQLVFDSFYNARAKGPGIHRIIMRPSLQARAATNYFWISASNSSAYYSWPSVFIQPDGTILGQLKANRPGVMVNIADTTREYYDASRPNRDRAMNGILNSGKLVDDPRSRERQSL